MCILYVHVALYTHTHKTHMQAYTYTDIYLQTCIYGGGERERPRKTFNIFFFKSHLFWADSGSISTSILTPWNGLHPTYVVYNPSIEIEPWFNPKKQSKKHSRHKNKEAKYTSWKKNQTQKAEASFTLFQKGYKTGVTFTKLGNGEVIISFSKIRIFEISYGFSYYI